MSENPGGENRQTTGMTPPRIGEVVSRDSRMRLIFGWPSDRNDGLKLSRLCIIGPPIGIGLGVVIVLLILHYQFNFYFTPEFINVIAASVASFSVWAIIRGSFGVKWVYRVLERAAESASQRTVLRLWLAEWAVFLFGPISLAGAGYVHFFGPRMGVTLAVESLLPAGTIVYLALFTRYSTRAFSNDMTRLLDRSEKHWNSQTQALTTAITALNSSLAVQSQVLKVATDTLDLDRKLLELEEARRQRLMPHLVIAMAIPTGILAVKHMEMRVHNTGMDGHGLAVFFGIHPNSMLQDRRTRIDSQDVAHFDFGSISVWPDTANLRVSCEVADTGGQKYRFAGEFQYQRNQQGLHSEPIVTPPYMIPTPEPIS